MRALLAVLLLAPVQAREIRNLPYVASGSPLQRLDLHLPEAPANKPLPVLVAIHGGGWSIGDKANPGFVAPKFRWFNEHGFLVVSVNYRLSPAVHHPAHVQDVCAAIAWLETHIGEHGGDPRRLYLLGHSAGAHLAALSALDQSRLKAAGADPTAIRGVILLDGAGYDVPRQMAAGNRLQRVGEIYADAFTHDPDVQRDASPVFKVTRTPPPFLILHVARRPDSAAQSKLLAAALAEKGGTATVVGIPGKSHLTINRDLGKPGDPTTEAVAAFLELDR